MEFVGTVIVTILISPEGTGLVIKEGTGPVKDIKEMADSMKMSGISRIFAPASFTGSEVANLLPGDRVRVTISRIPEPETYVP